MDKPKDPHRGVLALSVLACILSFAGVGFLVKTTVELVHSGCPLAFIGILAWGGFGLMSFLIAAIVLVAIGQLTRYKKSIGTALAFIVVGLTSYYFVAVPWAADKRIARHQQIMVDEGLPILRQIVVSLEEWCAENSRTPKDESEFHEVIDDRDMQRLGALRCCWGITYRKMNLEEYHLRYFAMDIEYVYDSREAARGWYAVETGQYLRDSGNLDH